MVRVKDEVRYVDLDKVLPNPWQPERREDPQALGELAASILAHGLVETPVARPVGDGDIELATGHRRLAAHRMLIEQGHAEFGQMRVRIAELKDSQMADIVIQENKRRQDLDPIAEANLYRRYLDEFKVTQTELAKRVGCSQGEIANTMRLLELPDEAREMIISQEITPRHGREVLRAARNPEALKEVIEGLKKRPATTVAELHQVVQSRLIERGRAKPLEGYYSGEHAHFDTGGCKGCKDKIVAKPQHWSQEQPFCLNTECWEQKEGEAQEAVLEKAKAEGEGDILAYLGYSNYEELTERALREIVNPEECETCEHRKRMKASYSDRIETVCVNLKCYRRKKRQKTIEQNKLEKERQEKLQERIEAAACLAEAAPALDRHISIATLEALLRLGQDLAVTWFIQKYELPVDKRRIDIYALPNKLPVLLRDRGDDELRQMVRRLTLEIIRSREGARVNWYLRALEGGPTTIVLKHPDGTTTEVDVDRFHALTYYSRHGGAWEKPEHCYAYYYTDSGGSCATPVTVESFNELQALGVRSRWEHQSRDERGEEDDTEN